MHTLQKPIKPAAPCRPKQLTTQLVNLNCQLIALKSIQEAIKKAAYVNGLRLHSNIIWDDVILQIQGYQIVAIVPSVNSRYDEHMTHYEVQLDNYEKALAQYWRKLDDYQTLANL